MKSISPWALALLACLCATQFAHAGDDPIAKLKELAKSGTTPEVTVAAKAAVALHDTSGDPRVRRRVLTALGTIARGKAKLSIRLVVVEALGRIQDPDGAWGVLRRLLPKVFKKVGTTLEHAAIRAVGAQAPEAALPMLVKLGARAKAMTVQQAALDALAAYGRKRAREACLAALLERLRTADEALKKSPRDVTLTAVLGTTERALVRLADRTFSREELLAFAREGEAGARRLNDLPPEAVSPFHAQARKALARKDAAEARTHLLRALSSHPASPAVHGDHLVACADDADRRARALERAVVACSDAHGTLRVPPYWPSLPQELLVGARARAKARARCIAALAAQAGTADQPSAGMRVELLERLARTLARGAPHWLDPHVDTFASARAACAPDTDRVMSALLDVFTEHEAAGAMVDAFDVAHTVVALEQQFHNSAHADADSERRARGRAALAGARTRTAVGKDGFYDSEKLRAAAKRARELWTERHARLATPAVGMTPKGRYRVESTCGYETLASALRYLEVHHARIAAWMGKDPFEGRPGTVRLHPTPAEMEGEQTPFWWARGFQRGDLTVGLVRWTTHAELARLLTHELTHRFDGVLYPGMPTWLVEGRAVYTASCTPHQAVTTLDERAIDWNHIEDTSDLGYTHIYRLRDFLKGKPRDPRHNYPVGYSLYLYLRRFGKKSAPTFAKRLEAYQRRFADGPPGNPIEAFVSAFADGKEGRPDGLEAFAASFATFIDAFMLPDKKRPVWARQWVKASRKPQAIYLGAIGRSGAIRDPLTRARDRNRLANVPPGEEHAYRAAQLLARAGRAEDAMHAYAWALATDEPLAPRWVRATAHIASLAKTPDAWAAHVLRQHTFAGAEVDVPAHGGEALQRATAELRAMLGRDASDQRPAHPGLAAMLHAEHDELARLVGLGPIAKPSTTAIDPTWTSTLLGAVMEVPWSRVHNERKDLVRVDPGVEIALGRHVRANDQTGSRDRGIRPTYAESEAWHEGVYTFRTRVMLLSEFARAFVTIGATRSDRGIEIQFKGNDPVHEEARKDMPPPFKSVRIRARDFRAQPLDRLSSWKAVPFKDPQPWFDLEVEVFGARLTIYVNQRAVGTLRRVTGAAIEGRIGYGLEVGFVTYVRPEVAQHGVVGDGRRTITGLHDIPMGLDRAPPQMPQVGDRLQGVAKGRPALMVLYHTSLYEGARSPVNILAEAARLRDHFKRQRFDVDIVLAAPPTTVKAKDGAPIDLSAPKLRTLVHRTVVHQWDAFLAKWLETLPAKARREQSFTPLHFVVDTEGEVLFLEPMVPYGELRRLLGR